jgi:transcriptional regulator with XRE-family HTH domain
VSAPDLAHLAPVAPYITPPPPPLAQLLREWREYRGLSMQQLADRAGISKQCVFKLEHGVHLPVISTLTAIATALDLTCSITLEPHEDSADVA